MTLHYRWKAHKVTVFTALVLAIESHHMSYVNKNMAGWETI